MKFREGRIEKKFDIAMVRGSADPTVNALIGAQTNDEKIVLLKLFKKTMGEQEFQDFRKALIQHKIVSRQLFRKLND